MRRLIAMAGMAGLMAGALAAIPHTATAADTVPPAQAGTLEIWGYTGENQSATPVRSTHSSESGPWIGAGGGNDDAAYGIRRNGSLVRTDTGSNELFDVPTSLNGQQVVSVDSNYDVAAAVTTDGVPHIWGDVQWAMMPVDQMPTTPAALGGRATQIEVSMMAIAVLLDTGQVGVLSPFGYEIADGLENVAEIELLNGDVVVARLAGGGALNWHFNEGVIMPPVEVAGDDLADPLVDIGGHSKAVGVTESGQVYVWGGDGSMSGLGDIFPEDQAEGLVVQVTGTRDYHVALTDQNELVVWGGHGVPLAAMEAGAEELSGQEIASIDGGVKTVRAVISDPPPPLAALGDPAVAGTAQVGQTLTGTPGTFNVADTVTNQWLADGVAIPGATSTGTAATTLALTAAHQGKKISLESTGVSGEQSVTVRSAETAAVAAAPVQDPPLPDPPPATSTTKVLKTKVAGKGKKVVVRVRVTAAGAAKPTGRVKIVIKRGKKKVAQANVAVNAKGVAKLNSKKLKKKQARQLTKRGKYRINATYQGSATVAKSAGKGNFKV